MQDTLIESYGAVLSKAFLHSSWALADELEPKPAQPIRAPVRFFAEAGEGSETFNSIGRTKILSFAPVAFHRLAA